MARRTLAINEEEPEINLSSMIDCIFILLIFFIVTTVFVEEKGLSVHKPDAAAPSVLEEHDNVVFEISQQNEVFLDGTTISLSEIPTHVKASVVESDTPVVIRVHEKARHETFVAVWDAARRGGAETLSFSTVN